MGPTGADHQGRRSRVARSERLAEQRSSSMAETLDAALDALRRHQFYEGMADAEASLLADPQGWASYIAERDAWLNPDLASTRTSAMS